MQAQKVYVRDLMINCLDRNRYYRLIPCTILNRYCFTCIVHTYKESLKCCFSTSVVFICSKIAHIHTYICDHRRSESELLDNVFQPHLIFNVSSCLRSPHPHRKPPPHHPHISLPSASRLEWKLWWMIIDKKDCHEHMVILITDHSEQLYEKGLQWSFM